MTTIQELADEFGAQPHEVAAFADLGTFADNTELDAETEAAIREAWAVGLTLADEEDAMAATRTALIIKVAGEIFVYAMHEMATVENAAETVLRRNGDLTVTLSKEPDFPGDSIHTRVFEGVTFDEAEVAQIIAEAKRMWETNHS